MPSRATSGHIGDLPVAMVYRAARSSREIVGEVRLPPQKQTSAVHCRKSGECQ